MGGSVLLHVNNIIIISEMPFFLIDVKLSYNTNYNKHDYTTIVDWFQSIVIKYS